MRRRSTHERRGLTRALLAAGIALVTLGCSPIPKLSDEPQKKCTREFHLWSNDEPLGSSAEFLRVAEQIAATAGAVTSLAEIARGAGWPERGWDRVVVVGGGTSSADLNELAGTAGICFDGFSGSDPDSGFNGYYVFFDGSHPKQTAGTGSRPVIDTDGHPLVRRNDPLVSDTSLKMPVLRPVPAEAP